MAITADASITVPRGGSRTARALRCAEIGSGRCKPPLGAVTAFGRTDAAKANSRAFEALLLGLDVSADRSGRALFLPFADPER